MPAKYIRPPKCFLTAKRKRDIKLETVSGTDFTKWLGKQSKAIQDAIKESGFEGKRGQIFPLVGKNQQVEKIIIGISHPLALYDFSYGLQKITALLSEKTIKSASFSLSGKGNYTAAYIGWGLTCYNFDLYKKNESPLPCLVMPASVDKKRVHSTIEAMTLIRDLVNTPANDLGPAELEKAVKELALSFKATVKITNDTTLKKEFPLIFAVGDSSPRRPRLIDLTWGNPKHPKVTLVGKGVCFDTGGLDLKPSQYMALMKKDMGGAAHALGVARLIMGTGLPVRLRVLIPAVENAVSGVAFRPGDVFNSRKGLKVENTNTDAEGRLILADALTYACEEKPDLVIDFATLTGSARAALGSEIPAIFSNNDSLAEDLKKAAFREDDPVWPMPLWQPYKKIIESTTGDLVNSVSTPGDLIYSALFLESFLLHDTDWIHLDIFSWENNGKPGRPKGGADTGMRAVFAFLEKKYGK
ncbi:MAG: leucyl aminopeptidase [Alphaproteobacteria bacterium CG_4_9_14_3_um_filter_47_13]|nr:MAG: leucyl aminopeptidase [Alphaproteobacteria bacterium CG_4_9_14_3_um_filter_47_13]